MDESENIPSELRKTYDILFELIEEKLPGVLDEGNYTDNAGIIRQVNRLLTEKEIFTLIPQIAERTTLAIWGYSDSIDEIFKQITTKELGIHLNTNLPMLLVPMEEESDIALYAYTYIGKLLPISFDDYQCIAREIYKDKIDIRKLVKGYVLFCNEKYCNLSYLILPEYVDTENTFFEIISSMVDWQFLITDSENKWKKQIHRLLDREIYLLGTEADLEFVKSKISNQVILYEKEQFRNLCETRNAPCINFSICVELQKIFLDVSVFYCRLKSALNEKIMKLAEDSVYLEPGQIKEQVQKYRVRSIRKKEELEESYQKFAKMYDEIMKAAREFELHISNGLMYKLSDNTNSDKYRADLINVFFKHVYVGEFDAVKEDMIYLTRANYKYLVACKCLMKCKQGFELSASDMVKLQKYPDSVNEVAKIKIELSKSLGLHIADLKELINNVSDIESGKEYYYLGKRHLDEKNYVQAAEAFMNSLDRDYEKAGIELIKLAQNHPECNIDIEKLAENLVAEANYQVGIDNILQKYRKGLTNLKIAASRKHRGAIEVLADILFEDYKYLSWQKMKEEKNRHAVNNVIDLYSFLEKKWPSEQYRLRIGLMYCKLNEYARAYSMLKDIDSSDAQYECAKMCQYGNGVAKDLKMAKMHYEKIPADFKDVQVQYEKVCRILNDEKQKRTSYNEKRSYSSTSSYSSSSSSDFCFITTAACLALNESKDCEQLNELRRFRDVYISGDGEDGDDLVAEYYRIGPTIVQYIDSEWNPFAIYTELWQDFVLPSCKMIKINQCDGAKQLYVEMVKLLCEKYRVSVKENIMKKYSIGQGYEEH